jgi:hypothetical protein
MSEPRKAGHRRTGGVGRSKRQVDPKANQIAFRLDGPRITAGQFRKAVDAFFALLEEVSERVTGKPQSIEWIVSVKAGSAYLMANPQPRRAGVQAKIPAVSEAIYTGMKQLGRRATRPKGFSDDALELARDLFKIADGKNIAHASIQRSGATDVDFSLDSVARVDSILGQDVRDYGSIEGRLEMMSVRGGPHFAVYSAIDDSPIRCDVDGDRLDEAYRAFRKRVIVSGLIRYHKGADYRPARIEVMEPIRILPSENELPSVEEIYGAFSKVE